MNAYQRIGELEHENLIYDHKHPLDVKSVRLSAGTGMLKRGTLISVSEPGGDGVIWDGIGIADCILCDDTDITEEVCATAYRTGHFIRQSLIVAEGAELTDQAENELRCAGIFLSSAVGR